MNEAGAMSDNRLFQLLAGAYVLVIYGTSGWMRLVSTLARQLAGDLLGPLMTTDLIMTLAAILAVISRSRRLLPYVPIVLGYCAALAWLTIPEERFHLLQYGILCLLCDRALLIAYAGNRLDMVREAFDAATAWVTLARNNCVDDAEFYQLARETAEKNSGRGYFG